MGVYDVFRAVHPKLQAVTRVPTGKQDQAARRLDAVYASKEMTDHPAVRAGIHMGSIICGAEVSDHRPLIIDLPLDCAA